jgi:hypothetical protein
VYFGSPHDARKIARLLGLAARVVQYEMGWAVQYYKSGPYVTERDLKNIARENPVTFRATTSSLHPITPPTY